MQDFIIRKHKLDKKMMYLYRHPETGGLNPEKLSDASSLRDSARSATACERGEPILRPEPKKEEKKDEKKSGEAIGAKENEYQKQMDMIKNKANNSIEAIRRDRKEKYELLK